MKFNKTPLAGAYVIELEPFLDERGVFARTFCQKEFATIGFHKQIVQINHSLTRKRGAIRGLHFQHPPYAEVKIISCIHGEVFDVAVDIRKGSPTFLEWHGEVISAKNRKSLLIPEGFAHGFQTLDQDCELIYLHSAPYCDQAEGALHVNDPRISVVWPFPATIISDRDRCNPFLPSDFEGIVL